jgi:Cu(I)/Ag(I) efflux system membrane fusion protein
MSLFSRAGHGRWTDLSKKVKSFATEVSEGLDILAARKGFLNLSQTVIDLQSTFGHSDTRDYYLTYCPMTNDSKGAYWLQTVDTVYNSMYGASMLRCGEIKKPLAARSSGEGK